MVSDKVAKGLASLVREVPKDKIGQYITASDKHALEMAFADVATLMDAPVMMTLWWLTSNEMHIAYMGEVGIVFCC